jgi:hypothetical protein
VTRTAAALALAVALALATACAAPAEPEPIASPFDRMASVAAAAGGGYAVDLRSDAAPQVGLNALHLRVTASGVAVTDATVAFEPVLATSAGLRTSPVFGPGPASPDGVHALAAVFDAASDVAAAWSAKVTITRGGSPVTIALPAFPVVPGKDLARRFEAAGTGYVMALEFTQKLRAGLNPVAVTLHATADRGATYAPVADAALALDPWMPSMGHDSPGSANPVHTPAMPAGWYEGQVSFSMAGDWETIVTATRAGVVVGAPPFLVFF